MARSFRRERWRKLDTFGSPPLVRHSTAAVVINHVMYIFGGMAAGRSDDLSMLDLRTRMWTHQRRRTTVGCPPPSPRSEHSMTAVGAVFFVFGGRADSVPQVESPRSSVRNRKVLQAARHVDHGDLFEYDTRQRRWTQHHRFGKGVWPTQRRSHTLTRVHDNELWLFGGSGPDYAHGHDIIFDDLLKLDLQLMRWEKLEPSGARLPPRTGHTATLVGSTLFIIGGISLDAPAAETNVLTLDTDTLVAGTLATTGAGPGVRLHHCAVVNEKRPSLIYVFGGREQADPGKPRHDRDVFALNLETSQWEPVATSGTPAPVRTNHVMAPHAMGDGAHQLVVFGGMSLEAGGAYCDASVHTLELLITGKETRKAMNEEMRFAKMQELKQREDAFRKKLRLSKVHLVPSPTLDLSWADATAYNGVRSMLSVDERRAPTADEVNWSRPQFPTLYESFKLMVTQPRPRSDIDYETAVAMARARPHTVSLSALPSLASSTAGVAGGSQSLGPLASVGSMASVGSLSSLTGGVAVAERPSTMSSLFFEGSVSVDSLGPADTAPAALLPPGTPGTPGGGSRRLPGVPPSPLQAAGPRVVKRFTAEQRRRQVPPPRSTAKFRAMTKPQRRRERYRGAAAEAARRRNRKKRPSAAFAPRLRPKTVGQISVRRVVPIGGLSDSDSDSGSGSGSDSDGGSSRRLSIASGADPMGVLNVSGSLLSGMSGSRGGGSGRGGSVGSVRLSVQEESSIEF